MRAQIGNRNALAITSALIGALILAGATLSIAPASAAPPPAPRAAAANAATPANAPAAASEDQISVEYEATFDHYYINADGSEEQAAPLEGSVALLCTSEGCELMSAAFDGYDSGLFAVPGSITLDIPAVDSCDATIPWGPGVVNLEFTAEHVTGTQRTEPLLEGCGSSFRAYGYRWEVLSSSLSQGACFFTEAGCTETATTIEKPVPEAQTPIGDADTGATSTSRLGTGDAAAPSVFSALATPAQAGTSPSQLALAVLLTIVLVILVALPTALLNAAVDRGSDRFSAWWRTRQPQPPADTGAAVADGAQHPLDFATTRSARRVTHTWWWAASGVLAAAVISAFVDPELGFNAGSLRVLLSIIVSFGIDVIIGWMLTIWITRRVAPEVTHSYVFKPATLLVVVLAVVFARLTGFEPGIIFGLVAGVAFGSLAGKDTRAKTTLATLGYAFGVALLAWAIYGLMPVADGVDASFISTFVRETLAAVAVGGMAALPIALVPLRGMAGHQIWVWRRWVWATCYAIGLLAFFIVLMPMPFSWSGVSLDLWVWIGIYLAYAVAAVLAWLLISRPWQRGQSEANAAATDDGVAPEAAAVAPDGR